MPFIKLRKKDMDVWLETQIINVKRTRAEDVSTSQISKQFSRDNNHSLNEWHTDSLDDFTNMLNNHDMWGLMDVGS